MGESNLLLSCVSFLVSLNCIIRDDQSRYVGQVAPEDQTAALAAADGGFVRGTGLLSTVCISAVSIVAVDR